MISNSHMGKLLSHSYMKSIVKDLENRDLSQRELKTYSLYKKLISEIEQELNFNKCI